MNQSNPDRSNPLHSQPGNMPGLLNYFYGVPQSKTPPAMPYHAYITTLISHAELNPKKDEYAPLRSRDNVDEYD